MRLENMVKEALEYCSYVSLPGLGSFSVRQIGSQADGEKGDLTAPRMVYGFNAQRQFDDSALVNHLIAYYDTDEQIARQIMEDFLLVVKKRLDNGEKIAFAGIGTLSQEGNDLVYTADALPFDSLLHTPNYNLKPIRTAKASKPGRKSSSSKSWMLAALGIILLSGAGLGGYYLYHKYKGMLFDKPAANGANEPNADSGSLVAKALPLPKDKAETIAVLDSVHRQGNALRVENRPRQNSNPKTSSVKPEKKDAKKLWYIVVGGYFSKHEGAVYVKEERRRDGYDAHIQAHKNGWRVIIGHYTTYPDALRAKNIFCTKENNPDAAYVPKEAVLLGNLE